MTPTKQQKDRRNRSFKFTYNGEDSWFYLCDGRASFHQVSKEGQRNVFGLSVKRIITALKACGYIVLLLCLPVVAEAKEPCKEDIVDGMVYSVCMPKGQMWATVSAKKQKEVAMPYEDFLQVITKVEHSEKLKNKAMAENGVLLKLKGEQDTIIKVQADQIKACEAIVQEQEKLGATQDQLSRAVEAELRKVQQELAREKRLSRYKSEAFWMGVVGVVIMAVIN